MNLGLYIDHNEARFFFSVRRALIVEFLYLVKGLIEITPQKVVDSKFVGVYVLEFMPDRQIGIIM